MHFGADLYPLSLEHISVACTSGFSLPNSSRSLSARPTHALRCFRYFKARVVWAPNAGLEVSTPTFLDVNRTDTRHETLKTQAIASKKPLWPTLASSASGNARQQDAAIVVPELLLYRGRTHATKTKMTPKAGSLFQVSHTLWIASRSRQATSIMTPQERSGDPITLRHCTSPQCPIYIALDSHWYTGLLFTPYAGYCWTTFIIFPECLGSCYERHGT